MSQRDLQDDSALSTDSTPEHDGEADDRLELVVQLEMLTEENRRLQEAYARSRRSQYRHTAFGLAILGIVAVIGGLLFPDGRDVLFALGGTGLFGGLLTYYLMPNRFVSADLSERMYATMATNYADIVDELGLRDERIYVPTGDSTLARLFVPQRVEYDLPEDFSRPIETAESQRGLVLVATGTGLFREFERTLDAELAPTPAVLGEQLSDGLVESLELARSANADVDVDVEAAEGRATVAVSESALGPVDRFDHPIASFVATGFAIGLDQPITLEVAAGSTQEEWLVTCRWELEAGATDEND
ncbi:hypothetical protein ACLI4Q_18085 [Natrialbaceae archaeon A-CW1-1]